VLQCVSTCCGVLQCVATCEYAAEMAKRFLCVCSSTIAIFFIFIAHFPQKSPIINGSFAKNDLQLLCVCSSTHAIFVTCVCVSIFWRIHRSWCMHLHEICVYRVAKISGASDMSRTHTTYVTESFDCHEPLHEICVYRVAKMRRMP